VKEKQMPDLIPYDAGFGMRRSESRQLSRRRTILAASVSLETARIEAAADIQAVRAEAMTYVGKRAMQNVAMMTKLEEHLALMVPLTSGRL
jgi:hypothetical protein